MDWKAIFRNRRAEAAEANVERIVGLWKEQVCQRIDAEVRLIEAHREHVAAIEALNTQLQFEAMRERTELKKAHAEELKRVIEEKQKLWDELTKVRYVETPALRQVQVNSEKDDSAPPSPKFETPVGTPWQRVQKFYADQEERAAKVRLTKPAETPVEGAQHGDAGDGRNSAPLGEPSKVA